MIELNEIAFGYRHHMLLNHIDLTFEKGKVTTVVGPNGCGKSTLLKLASGLLKPGKGKVCLCGRDISGMKSKELAREMAVLPQFHAAPDLSVDSFVRLGRHPYLSRLHRFSEEDREAVEKAMDETDTACLREKSVSRLSGGERQRVYIAMALAQDTDIILLDEPTTFLDIRVQFEIMEIVKKLHQAGKTIVMVLHDLNMAIRYSDNMVLMERGRIVARGPAGEVAEGGRLQQVFGVDMEAVGSGCNRHYLFVPSGKIMETQGELEEKKEGAVSAAFS